jgi:hypothetical protein
MDGKMNPGLSKIKFIALLVMTLLTFGCVATPKDYTKFQESNPRSILIIPVVNNSPQIGADNYFLATVSLPLAERGYYVFPVHMTKELLIESGLNDPGLIHQAEPSRLGKLFGADAILYITIDHWEAKYIVISTTVTVGFAYVMKDAKTGEVIWEHREVMNYSPQNSNTGNPLADLTGAVVNAAITKAIPNYVPLARQANEQAFGKEGQGLPAGPYHPDYRKDISYSK